MNLPEGTFLYDVSGQIGTGTDPASYVGKPPSRRPWLSVPGVVTFVWPVGIEGFDIAIEPTLGIHKYIGDNSVEVDVVHRGQETISLNGFFPGKTSAKAMRQLHDVVYREDPPAGKLLSLPGVLASNIRVTVQSARFSHGAGSTWDINYTLDLVRVRGRPPQLGPTLITASADATPEKPPRGQPAHVFTTTATINTLRKIALEKLDSAAKWNRLYRLNADWFNQRGIAASKAPDYRLDPGLEINY